MRRLPNVRSRDVDVGVRLIEAGDVAPLTELLHSNWEFLAPWEPVRDDAYFTEERQRVDLE